MLGPYLLFFRDRQKANREEWRGLGFTYLCMGVALLLSFVTVDAKRYYKIQYLPYLTILSVVLVPYLITKHRPTTLARASVVLLAGALILIQLFSAARKDFYASLDWYVVAREHGFQISTLPDQVVAAEVSRHAENTVFVYGNRSWIYLLSDTTSPNEYFYRGGLFIDGLLSEEDFETVLTSFERNPPQVIVFWTNRPELQDDEYNATYVNRFETWVNETYVLEKEAQLDNTWPYTLREPILVYSLAR